MLGLRLLSFLVLGLLPTASLAQHRLYVGAGAAVLTDAPFANSPTTIVGPAATVGWQFSPRWAIQTGGQLAWRNSAGANYYDNPDGTRNSFQHEEHSTLLLVPVLARYTFTTSEAARLQVEALGGANWLYSRTHSASTITFTTNSGDVEQLADEHRYSYSGVGLALGPQLRYRLGRALGLVASAPVLLAIGSGSLRDRLILNAQLGAQLALGR